MSGEVGADKTARDRRTKRSETSSLGSTFILTPQVFFEEKCSNITGRRELEDLVS